MHKHQCNGQRMTESVLLTLILRFIRRYTSFPYKVNFIGQLTQNRKIMACQNQCAPLFLLKKQISHHFYAVCIQCVCRLINQKQRRIFQNCSGNA